MTTKTIAITGATGQFGAIALDLLKAKQANVIALVRSPEKISGVEARKFDYSKTEGQVEALQGVDTLILVSSNEIGQRFAQHNNVIEAAKKAGVKKTDSGLLYKIEKAGEGASPSKTDMVKVHYKGTLPDGTVFDSSYDRNAPVEFQLDQLIPAWVEAIPMLKKGGKMEIVVPPALGYGDRSAGKIPANSTLKFEVELLDFKPAK